MGFAITPPIEPMLAKLADDIPEGEDFFVEPKWDGFRAIVFRGDHDLYIQSRDLRPLDRYFPELHDALLKGLPPGCVVDGEIVIATPKGLDFDTLQLRLHPAASRVAKLAKETPSSFVAFDLLAVGGRDIMASPQRERREQLERLLQSTEPPIHLTPMTRDRRVALDWHKRFEGAGLDGVIVKVADAPYQPGKRAMIKVKHARTADCVVAGFRWYKGTPPQKNRAAETPPGTPPRTSRAAGTPSDWDDAVGSLLLGLYDDRGKLHHVGVTSSFTLARRKELARELEPLRKDALKEHPWRDWAEADAHGYQRMPGGQSRWSAGKDLSWEPLRLERVCEVKYDHMQGDRFRHAAVFLRWRPDKAPQDCRYDQLEVTTAYELAQVFQTGRASTPREHS